MNRCKNCGKEVSNKATYCGDKCRMAFKRKSDTQPEQKGEQEQPEHSNPNKLTATDQTFYDRDIRDRVGEKTGTKPGDYYYFTANRHKRECMTCGKKFVTSLQNNKFCSYEHYRGKVV